MPATTRTQANTPNHRRVARHACIVAAGLALAVAPVFAQSDMSADLQPAPPADFLSGPSVDEADSSGPTLVERRFDGTLVTLERFPELEAIDRMDLSAFTEAEVSRALDERAAVIDGILQGSYRRIAELAQSMRAERETQTDKANGGTDGADGADARRQRTRSMQPSPEMQAMHAELTTLIQPLADRGPLAAEISAALSESERALFEAMVREYRVAELGERARQRQGGRTNDMPMMDDARDAMGARARRDRGQAGGRDRPDTDAMLDFENPVPIKDRDLESAASDASERGQGERRRDRTGPLAERMREMAATQGYVREILRAYQTTSDMRQEQNEASFAELGLSTEQEAQLRSMLRARAQGASDGASRRENAASLREFMQGLSTEQQSSIREFFQARRGTARNRAPRD